MQESKSEVAQFRQRQALEEQAAQSGLLGLAMGASHAAILPVWKSARNAYYDCFKRANMKRQKVSWKPRHGE